MKWLKGEEEFIQFHTLIKQVCTIIFFTFFQTSYFLKQKREAMKSSTKIIRAKADNAEQLLKAGRFLSVSNDVANVLFNLKYLMVKTGKKRATLLK